jgi:hypothetical protein
MSQVYNITRLNEITGAPSPARIHIHIHFTQGIFWLGHIPRVFGIAGGLALMVSIMLFFLFGMRATWRRLRRQSNDPDATRVLGLMFIMLMPCLLYTAVFSKHVTFPWHFFAAYKFIIPFATIPFVLLPLYVHQVHLVHQVQPRKLSTAILAIALCYLAWEISQYEKAVSRFHPKPELVQAATFLKENTAYNDVVFSMQPEYCTISEKDLLAYSMKAVHPLSDLNRAMDSLHQVLAEIHDEYVVNILILDGEEQPLSPFLRDIYSKAFETITGPGFRLLKIHKADYLAVCKEAAPRN